MNGPTGSWWMDARPTGGQVDAAGDHRLVMAFASRRARRHRTTDDQGATRSACPTPPSSRISPGWAVMTDKIYLVGFMASGKSTIARALARASGARRGRGRADRAPRAGDGRAGLRDAWRAVFPIGRARDPQGPPASAPRRRRDGWRNVRRSRQPRGDQPRRRIGLDRRAARRSHPAYPARRPASAGGNRAEARAADMLPGWTHRMAHIRISASRNQAAAVAERILDTLHQLPPFFERSVTTD